MALNADRERDVELTLAGRRVLRFTYAHLVRRSDCAANAIVDALLRFNVA